MINPIFDDFKAARIMIRSCFRFGRPRGVVLTSPPGLGKSYEVKALFKEQFNRNIPEFSGSARGLLEFLNEDPDAIVLIDDFDKAFYNPDILTLFKKMLDSNEPRILSHSVMGQNYRPPFRFTGGAIICCNIDFNNATMWSRRMWEIYIKPFKSRLSTSIIRISFSPADVYDYTCRLAPKILSEKSLIEPETKFIRKLNDSKVKEIIDHLRKNYDSYPDISPRLIENLGDLRLGAGWNDDDWHLLRRRLMDRWSLEKEQEKQAIEEWKNVEIPDSDEGNKPKRSALLPHIYPGEHTRRNR
jgi:hypothetical protein